MAPTFRTAAIATVVHDAIREAGYTLKTYSDRSGVPVRTLSRLINGHTRFAFEEVVQVADITGVPLSEIVRRTEQILNTKAAS